jgi:ubiquinone/menaquinone biosynthesis C-methylase UbiE
VTIVSAEAKVASHYGKGGLEQKIFTALKNAGIDMERPTVEDLAPVDEFHIGGLESTKELAAQMDLRPGLRVLDVGSGIGGPARYFAAKHGCRVTGVDLTEEFIQVANSLTRVAKLEALVDFHRASALQMPFESAAFDRASMIHVGMNIADKDALFREVRRVLKPGALFAVFDLVRTAPGPLSYPLPWAATEETSFVSTANDYRDALQRAGFRLQRERGRRDYAIEFTERRNALLTQDGPPLLGLQLLIGEKTPLVAQNVLDIMKQGLLEPTEFISRST